MMGKLPCSDVSPTAPLPQALLLFKLLLLQLLAVSVEPFQFHVQPTTTTTTTRYITAFRSNRTAQPPSLNLWGNNDDSEKDASSSSKTQVEEYRNVVTKFLSNFMNKDDDDDDADDTTTSKKSDPFASIDFDAPKLSKKLDLETMAAVLDAELYEKEWFVTGNVNPIYFADTFRFQDPDVKLEGIEAYARGVNQLFDQTTSRAEIISTQVNPELGPNIITCTWRLSGYARIGPGLRIKPYIVYTDFRVDPESGLIDFQEDRFDLPTWDILLSSLFPFLIGKITAPPAPPVEPRNVVMPKI